MRTNEVVSHWTGVPPLAELCRAVVAKSTDRAALEELHVHRYVIESIFGAKAEGRGGTS